MQRAPLAAASARRAFSLSAAARQGARGRWWNTQLEAAPAASLSRAAPAGTAAIIDTTDIPVANAKTLAQNPFAAEVAAQAPNLPHTWSKSQRPRGDAIRGARFEQTDIAAQPFPLAAEALIAEEPIRIVHGNRAVCDGGGGSLGHPRVFIPLDKPGDVFPCGYCGIRFKSDGSRAHH